MNKITKYLLSIIAIVLAISGVYYAVKGFNQTTETSIEPDDIEIPEEQHKEIITHVKVDENLLIDLETSVDPNSLNEKSMQILDENGEQVDSSIELINNNQTLRIAPPDEHYKKHHMYQIIVDESLSSSSQTYYFKTERDPVEKAVLNPDLKFIPEAVVQDFSEDSVILSKDNLNEFEVGDVIVLTLKDAGQEMEKAITITKVTEKNDVYELEYGIPYFEDIYDSIDIYGTYNIEADHIELADPSFTLETLHASRPNNLYASTEAIQKPVDKLLEHPFRKEVPHEHNKVHVIDIGEVELSYGDSSLTLSGDVRILRPYLDPDISFNKSFDFREWLALDLILNLGAENNIAAEISTSLNEADVDLANLDEEFRIGKIAVPFPAAPALFFEVEIIARIETDARGAVSISTSYRSFGKFGVNLHKGDLSFVNDTFSDYEANSISGSGKAEFLFEMGLYSGLSSLDVFGVGLENVLGMDAEASAHMMSSTDKNLIDNGQAASVDEHFMMCAQADYELYMQMYFDLGFRGLVRKTLEEIPLGIEYRDVGENHDVRINERGLRLVMLKHILKEGELGNCQQFIEFVIEQEELKLKNDDRLDLKFRGKIADVSRGIITEEVLSEKDFHFSVADEDIAQVDYAHGHFAIKTAEEPTGPKTILTVEYLGDLLRDAQPLIEIPITIENYDELNPIVNQTGKSTMTVSELEEKSLYTFTSSHNQIPYHVYFYADNEENEIMSDSGFAGQAGDMMASGDYSLYLAADGDDLAYKQEHLDELSYFANREFAPNLHDTLELVDTTIFTVFVNEGVRLNVPYSYMYKNGELYELDIENEIGYVYFTEFEANSGNSGIARSYIMTETDFFWRNHTFEVDVENEKVIILEVEDIEAD